MSLMFRLVQLGVIGFASVLLIPTVSLGAEQAGASVRQTTESVHSDISDSTDAEQLVRRYCAGCHNESLRSGGLSLVSVDLAEISEHGEVLETVLMKLRAGAMPPVGRPRPDAAMLSDFVSWLEASLDQAALDQPNPGRTATFHRLNRTEYKNAIRDILGLDVDASELLPADDAAFGFDNIGEMLTVSPVFMCFSCFLRWQLCGC